ncbi:hypothetical protein OsJ_33033 [Oryza sativa Japonica Group]|uniref:Late embryogenesis abundant protein LEA-2 subgroup domain-containing protein n=1 Tax=Oryza sativa subsp. japonica TaxID=39947 RepID=A3C8T8_ORYSJ|nr:hypothetical protein OsJ_33033 [Oryza sativa Japonica Group]
MGKDCGNHGDDDIRQACRRLLTILFGLALIVAIIALIVYLVTVASRNPNDRVGVYYDRLDVYASYKYQQITLAASLPPVYQGHGDVDVWSPVLSGPDVPFAPYLGDALAKDVAAEYLILQVKIDGRVRWKVGSWISGHYHLFVTCPAFFIASGGNGYPGANGLKFQTATYCRVEV